MSNYTESQEKMLAELTRHNIQVLKHQNPQNKNLLQTSLAFVIGVSGGVVAFYAVDEATKQSKRIALPISAITGNISLTKDDLSAAVPRKKKDAGKGVMRQKTELEYFNEDVTPFMIPQGIAKFYAANV